MITRHQIGSWCRALTPTLSYADFKGTCGRVALIGGSSDGGSAATLATAAALRCGADLVYIMCRPEAKPFIDGLSVRPLFTEASIAKCREVVRMCDVLCVSDGLFGEPAADIESARLLGLVLGDAAFHRIPTVLGAATGNVVACAADAVGAARRGRRCAHDAGELVHVCRGHGHGCVAQPATRTLQPGHP
jgi:NAD(P)H-hydrate repair Nnr-like enzyme with NAD(P)H-hydrate dehydratase domain